LRVSKNIAMSIDKIIHQLLNTTENTYSLYEKLAKKCTANNLEAINEVFKTVSAQQLIIKYIPEALNEDGTFNFPYKKGYDDRFIGTKQNSQKLEPYQYDGIAALKWIERKRKDIEKIRLNPIAKGKLYPTLYLNTQKGQKLKLLNLLKESYLIDNNTSIDTFIKALSGNLIEDKPQIIFLKKRQSFTYLLLKLKLNDCKEYNDIIEKSELFIYKNDKVIKGIKSAIDDYKHYEEDDFKPKYIIEKLSKGLENIFEKEQLLTFPYKSKN